MQTWQKENKGSLSVKRDRKHFCFNPLIGQQPLPRDTLQHERYCCAGAPARTGIITGAPTWHELFANAEHLFTEPMVEFGVLAASLFTSADSPNALLAKVEALACLSPVVIAMISDEEPDRITLLKNPRCFNGSILTPCPINGLLYGFAGSDTCNLAAVYIPPAAFKSSGLYNVLNDAATICAGLDTLPQDQLYHSYVVAGTSDRIKYDRLT